MVEASSTRNIRIEENAIGSAIVSGDGNTIYVIHHTVDSKDKKATLSSTSHIGPNPYKGLAAFKESDADRYFGREEQVDRLWQRFQALAGHSGRHNSIPRFLPILGPSGCGKSSLARAGFIPELAQRPLPGKEYMRVVVLMPGARPLEALAGVLAKVATNDPLPVEKTAEFERVLKTPNDSNDYEGLRRITSLIPNIRDNPLVILVDQFEEIYSLCKDVEHRQAFINNLFHAASDPTGHVSVVITLRSDFWVETQCHERLNQVIGSDQSVNVPAMTAVELRRAIAEPAKQAGYPLDEATIDLLVKDTEGREGALPMLQFALTRIWDGLNEGKSPSTTYREIDGVGGALASKAQEIYNQLTKTEQNIARRIFVGLVQLGEGTRDTRRRVVVENLIASRDTPETVQQVISQFSSPGVRLISLSSVDGREVAEVTHEALFEHWILLKEWLSNSRSDLYFHRRLEIESADWDKKGRPKGKLWRPPDLDMLRQYHKRASGDMTPLEMDFFKASVKNSVREKSILVGGVSTIAVVILAAISFSWQQWQERKVNELLALTTGDIVKPDLIPSAERLVAKANGLSQSERQADIDAALSYYRATIGFAQALDASVVSERARVEELQQAAENGLVELVLMKKFEALERQLSADPPQIGDRTGADNTDFDNQYSEGALQTTYNILRRQEGAKADIYDSGQISTYKEAERIPCRLLEEIEKIWREYTQNSCGWYAKGENHAFFDSDCDSLGGDTLTAKVFYDFYDAPIERLQSCRLVPEDVNLEYPF